MRPLRLAWLLSAALAVLVLAGAAAAAAPSKHAARRHHRAARVTAGANLLVNGGFEGGVSGWGGYRATLAPASDAIVGSGAAKVALASANLSDGFSIYPDALVTTTAGTTYSAGAWVRSATPGRQICLRIRERAGGSETGAAKTCVTAASGWARFGAVSFTSTASGRSLDVYAYEWAPKAGDSFEVDDVWLTGGDPPAPTPTPTPTPAPTPAPSAGLSATAVDNAHIALAWAPVAGAAAYRVSRGGLVVGTTTATSFTDALLWPQTAYAYTVDALGASGGVLSTLAGGATTAAIPASGFARPFPAASLWNTPVGPAAVDPNSAAMVAYLAANASSPNMTLHDWGVAVAEAHPGDQLFGVPCTTYSCTLSAFGPVPIPVTAAPDPSGDGHLAVYDPASGREWDMWQGRHSGGAWSASAGAALSLSGNGVVAAGTASADAANLALLAGLVRPEEILQGHIDHALVFGMPNVSSTRFVCPATHHDGGSTSPAALPEGTRVQLDPSLDVASLGLPTWEVPIARALQVYGMILRDTGGSLAIYAENPVSRGYDAWAKVGLPSSGSIGLTGIPWSRMRVLAPSC